MPVKLRKATPEQAYLKICLYGDAGAGKTLTALLIGEHLAAMEKKRMAAIDTERGMDFYSRDIQARKVHPLAFDFDRDITRSVTDVRDFMVALGKDPNPSHGVVILDSITHLWEAAKEAYSGPMTRIGTYPYTAWSSIKKPFREMLAAGLNGQFHFIFCGRLGWTFEEDENTGKDKATGTRVQSERNTGYEPHITCEMFQYREKARKEWEIRAFVEKDRSGILQGSTLIWPKPEDFEPVYRVLTGKQGTFQTMDEAADYDAARLEEERELATKDRFALFEHIRESIRRSPDLGTLKAAWELTVSKKRKLGDDNWQELSRMKDERKAEIVGGIPLRAIEGGKVVDIGKLQEVTDAETD